MADGFGKRTERVALGFFRKRVGPYALSALVVLVLAAVRASLDGQLEDRSRFLMFLPGAVLVAWLAGAGPGVVTLVGGALAGIFIVPATGERFAAHPGDLLSASLYLIAGVACIGIVQALRRTERTLHTLNSELEERVSERTADLDNALRDMQRFTYSMAHNMRSPLRAVVGYSRMIREDADGQLSRKTDAYLRRVDGSAKRMSHLIDDLLAYARLCGAEPEFERVDVSLVAKHVVESVLASHRSPVATIQIQPGLFAYVDRFQILDALTQIVDNAVKYRSTERQLKLIVRGESSVDGCRLVIEDNGIGFEMCYVDKVFEPFERLHADDIYTGTGIGLAIVARVVEKHHGTVRIESQPDVGTVVSVSFPRPDAVS